MPVLVLEDVAPELVPVDAVAVVVVAGVTLVSAPALGVEVDVSVELPLVGAVELGSDDVPVVVDAGSCESVAGAEAPLVLVPPVPVEADAPLGSPLTGVELVETRSVVLDDGWVIAISCARCTG